MTPANAFFADVTEESLSQANQLLAWLRDHIAADGTIWAQALANVLTPEELAINTERVLERLAYWAKEAPVGVFVGGTGSAKEQAGTDGEDAQRAFRLLKRTQRLVQAGKGRGKALIILDASPLTAQEFSAQEFDRSGPQAIPHTPPPESAPALLKRARDLYLELEAANRTLGSELATAKRRRQDLEREVAGLREDVAALRAQNAELETRMASQTWT